ncbi:uncharacterized protein L969DRAFT_97282 [Mixia osmundae IAM 14324]|uniref:Trafficking protein particle complex subunit 2-like protein n=1 Tax=Mixia osmundae (strain CBS 9802 / IAM 14324 / JCM 22182 / KY 12970) TaxID=764103 RepID=G7EB73_MIXOS|nr:uncharacterized protein L969DRAFT_97282 [Mixia osmundae IAM 14324]KEI36549.1 hypothetical protein L969DRAFT_97282 [Mixia osmundae IAM 14324]GAB00084.1 hypothetical protein E5Q_06786 [Mixia osmundae IAM 14324]
MALRILSIAVIGKHCQPLFVGDYTPSNARSRSIIKDQNSQREPALDDEDGCDITWHYVAHCSLDIFEERENGSQRPSDSYFGLLYSMDDYAVYGYTTNSGVRLVLTIGLVDVLIRDLDIKLVFRAIQNAYSAIQLNPFADIPESQDELALPIKSKAFRRAMDSIAGFERPRASIDRISRATGRLSHSQNS